MHKQQYNQSFPGGRKGSTGVATIVQVGAIGGHWGPWVLCNNEVYVCVCVCCSVENQRGVNAAMMSRWEPEGR